MPDRKKTGGRPFSLILLLVVLTIAGITLYDLPEGRKSSTEETPGLSQNEEMLSFEKTAPQFAMKNIYGRTVSSKMWEKKLVLLNFWASWCPPCLREIPEFSELRERYYDQGFEVIGIAVDDLKAVKTYLARMPEVKYPQLIGFSDAIELGKELGNDTRGLPFSALIDRNNVIRFIKKGELHKAVLDEQLQKLLQPRLQN